MAVLIDREWGGEFYHTYALDPATDEDLAALVRLSDQKKTWKREDLRRVLDEGKHPFWRCAIEHPRTSDLVVTGLTLAHGSALPDYVHDSCAGKLVSAKLADLLQEHEAPGAGYALFPVRICTASGEEYPIKYNVLDVYRKVDAVDPTSPALKSVGGPVDGNHRWTLRSLKAPPTRDDLLLSKSAVRDMAIWTDFRFAEGYFFVSDALHQRMCDQGITGFSVKSEWGER